MARTFSASVVVLVCGIVIGFFAHDRFGGGPRAAAPAPGIDRRLTLLTEENQRLRIVVEQVEAERKLAANKIQREAVEKQVVEIRGLPFKEPVDYQILDRKQIKETLGRKLHDVYSEQDFAHMSAALSRLGLLPEGYPLRDKLIDLLGEQVAAFYDQHTHKLYMFADASLDSTQNRVVLSHELMHALQDQYFGLKKLPLEAKTNDDMAMAAASLVEGEATLVMTEYMLKNLSLATLKDNLLATFGQNMEQLNKAPRYLRETLVFPYLRGQEFCVAIEGRGGYEALGNVYQRPPNSTAQILHPEKYFANPREEPVHIEWADLEVNAEQPIADNVLGEIGIRILFTEWVDASTGETASSGWRGDRYVSYANGNALAWKSSWATDRDAEEFFDAMCKTLTKRYNAKSSQSDAKSWTAESPRFLRIVRTPQREVIIIDAQDTQWRNSLSKRFGE